MEEEGLKGLLGGRPDLLGKKEKEEMSQVMELKIGRHDHDDDEAERKEGWMANRKIWEDLLYSFQESLLHVVVISPIICR